MKAGALLDQVVRLERLLEASSGQRLEALVGQPVKPALLFTYRHSVLAMIPLRVTLRGCAHSV